MIVSKNKRNRTRFPTAEELDGSRLKLAKGDLFNMDIRDVADITYCAFFVPDLASGDIETWEYETVLATINVSRTLRNGGRAFIDEGVFSGRNEMIDDLKGLIRKQDNKFNWQFRISNDPHLGLLDNYLIIDRVV